MSLIPDEIHCEPVGEIQVKGIAYPLRTYKVIASREDLGQPVKSYHRYLRRLSADAGPHAADISRIGSVRGTLCRPRSKRWTM